MEHELVDRLQWRHPSVKLLMGSPAVQALRVLGQQFPVLRVPSVVDARLRMQPTHTDWARWRQPAVPAAPAPAPVPALGPGGPDAR